MKVPTNVKEIERRARTFRVTHGTGKEVFVVDSDHSRHYVRRGDGGVFHCDCTWAQSGGVGCAHELAARIHYAEERGWSISVWATYNEAIKQRRRFVCIAGDNGAYYLTARRGKDGAHKPEAHNAPPVLRPISLVVGAAGGVR